MLWSSKHSKILKGNFLLDKNYDAEWFKKFDQRILYIFRRKVLDIIEALSRKDDKFVYYNGRKSQIFDPQGLSFAAGYKIFDPEQVEMSTTVSN